MCLKDQDNPKVSSSCTIWVVVKIMLPVRVLILIRHLIFRVPKKGP